MSDDLAEVPFEIASSGLDKVVVETARILFLWKRWKCNARKPTRERSVEYNKVGESSMDGDARR